MTYAELVQWLKERGLESLIVKINAERAKAQDNASTLTAKRTAVMAVERFFTESVSALLENRSARISLESIPIELVEELMAAFQGKPGAPAPTLAALDEAVKQGKKLKVDFDDGTFTARLGETVADGGTVEEALRKLVSKAGNWN